MSCTGEIQDISGPCFDEYCLAKAPSSQSWMCRPLRALRLGVRLFELTDSMQRRHLRIIQPNLPPNPINQQTSGCHALEKSQDISGPCFDEYCLAKAPSSQSLMYRPLRLGVRLFELTDSMQRRHIRIIQPNLPPNPINQQTLGDVMHGEIPRHIRPLLR